jgi:hypothetical protein
MSVGRNSCIYSLGRYYNQAMKTQPDFASADDLLRETDMRMAQALDNFFQRSRTEIQDAVLRIIGQHTTPSLLAIGQTCVEWLNASPDALSTAFADQFRQHLAYPVTFAQPHHNHPPEMQLLDDTTLGRQLAENKAAMLLSEDLQAEMLVLFSRLLTLRKNADEEPEQTAAYGPLSVIRALSRALDSLDFDPQSGTFLLQCVTTPLRNTLRKTYTALNQFLNEQGVAERARASRASAPTPRRTGSGVGQDILAHIQSVAAQTHTARPANALSGHPAPSGGTPLAAMLPRFVDRLTHWQTHLPPKSDVSATAPVLVLRQLQQDARHTDAGTFDLAVLDAVAGLFEFILDDPDVSPRYKSEIAQLQIPTLRVALVSPEFFSDDHHPARQLIDILGLFSRRFPEHNPSHLNALAQVEAACSLILDDPDHQNEDFAQAYAALATWLADENARTEAGLASEVANLEQIERQELGTLLALENLNDLTARHPVPESVLRRLETFWVPHMASLYVAEAGEGPDWRAACMTLLRLFLSLQTPDDDETRETRLQSIPLVNTELRHGLLAQGATPEHLKDFFSAITTTQECWVRPAVGQQETRVSAFVPRHVSLEQIESLAHQASAIPENDPDLQQAQQLLEGDWVDFDPPFEGLATARVAWVGVKGYLLFCDSQGERYFSLDCDRLAAEIRAGRARIPEQSLTRKAMLRLKTHVSSLPD